MLGNCQWPTRMGEHRGIQNPIEPAMILRVVHQELSIRQAGGQKLVTSHGQDAEY